MVMVDTSSVVAPGEQERVLLCSLAGGTKVTKNESTRRKVVDAWVTLAEVTRMDEQTIELLYDAFKVAEAEPFYRYVTNTHDKVAYQMLFSAQRTRQNKAGCSLRMYLSLLAYELRGPSLNDSLDNIARMLPTMARTRGKKPQPALRDVGKLLVKPLVGVQIDPLAKIRNSKRAHELIACLREPLENVMRDLKSTTEESRCADAILNWLEDQENASTRRPLPIDVAPLVVRATGERATDEQDEGDGAAADAEADAAVDTVADVVPEAPEQDMPEADGPDEAPAVPAAAADASGDFPLDIARVQSFLDAYRVEHERLETRVAELEGERQQEGAEGEAAVEPLVRRLDELEGDRDELRRRIRPLMEAFDRLGEDDVAGTYALLADLIETLRDLGCDR